MSRVFGLRCLAMLPPPADAEDADACHDDSLRDFEALVNSLAVLRLPNLDTSNRAMSRAGDTGCMGCLP